jgi:hypothetical protein
MIIDIIFILIIIIAIIFTINFMLKSIINKEWGQVLIKIGALLNAFFLIFLFIKY